VGREVAIEVLRRLVRLGLELGIARLLGELDRRFEVIGAREEPRPELDVGPDAVGLAQDVLCGPAVVPESRLRRARVELGQARLLAREVKDAPRSTGSAPPGRGRGQRPLVLGDPEVLEQDRTELDQPQG
jgi:hypothetical protein